MLAGLFFLLMLTDGALSVCSYRDVVEYLNFTKNKDIMTMTLPLKNSENSTEVFLDVLIYAILDVREKDQQFVTYLWVDMSWFDEYLSWNSSHFCDIDSIYVPTKSVWTPDIEIKEMTGRDKSAQNPFLIIKSNGVIGLRNDMVVVSSCKLRVYKFPFDTQICNLTFKSVIHSEKHLKLVALSSADGMTEWSLKMMQYQSEWILLNMTFSGETADNFGVNQSMVVYTITMKRRSVLYIVNFLLPVLLFLGLDLASFMISERGGEKLSFKVTVLLAVTVMQLILNEILPASSDRIPLIATYCIGIFGFMMLSLLETILSMYLMEKDSESQDNKAIRDQNLRTDCGEKRGNAKLCSCFRDVKQIPCDLACDVSSGETTSELLQVAAKTSHSPLSAESHDFEKELTKTLTLLLDSRTEEEKHGYWTRMAQKINRVFFIFYITTISMFFVFMYYKWNTEG